MSASSRALATITYDRRFPRPRPPCALRRLLPLPPPRLPTPLMGASSAARAPLSCWPVCETAHGLRAWP
eukprot:scaffold14233_cov148-Isochrysis_galbana.AAC.5